MDNASIHHVARIQEIIRGVGARLMYLPQYSPDFMPLEEVLARVKAALRENDSAYISTHSEQFIKLAFCTVTKNDCIGWRVYVKLTLVHA